MANFSAIHVVPAEGSEWAVQAQGMEPPSIHPTQGLAVARAWEIVAARAATEVIVHGSDGAIQSNLIILRHESTPTEGEFHDEAEEEALRRAAMHITPSRAELRALIGRLPAFAIDYSK